MCLIFDVCQSSTSIIIISLFRSLNQRFLEFRRNLGTFCNTIVDKSQGILIFLYSSSAFIRGVLIAKIFGWVGWRYYHVYIFASRTNRTKPFGFYLPLLKTCLKWKFLCSRDVGKCRGGSVRLYEKILFQTVGESVYYLIAKCP